MRWLRANMLSENPRSHALMRRLGRVVRRSYDGSALEIEIALD